MSNDCGPPPPQTVVTSVGSERLTANGQATSAHAPLVPDGLCHGAVLGAHATLCGERTELLAWFPGLPFARAEFLRRCSACLREFEDGAGPDIGEPHASEPVPATREVVVTRSR